MLPIAKHKQVDDMDSGSLSLTVQKLLGVWDKKNKWLVFLIKIGSNVPCLIMALSISNCGDFYLEGSIGFLPTTCDDTFYLIPGKKKVLDTTDHNIDEYFESSFSGSRRTTRFLLSTTMHSLSHRWTRGPPSYTPSPEVRQQSFQLLLRMHTNRFNQRLSMLESNTLDMKDSLENMRKQQSHFNSQLKTLARVLSPNDQKDRVNELANEYTDIKTRLSKLEYKLEILIDGFTALVQELDKVKRARHMARPPQDRRTTAAVATTLIPALTTAWITRVSTSRFQRRTVIPKTLPTPSISTTTFAQDGRVQKNESSTKFSTERIQRISTRRDIKANFTSKIEGKNHNKSSRRSTVSKGVDSHPLTTSSERLSTLDTSDKMQQNQQKRKKPTEVYLFSQARIKRQNVTSQKQSGPNINGKSTESQKTTRKHTKLQEKEESATKFQIPPPMHTKIPHIEKSAKSSKSSSKTPKAHIPSKKVSKSMKTQRNDLVVRPAKTDTNISKPSQDVQTKRRHSKTKSSKKNPLVPLVSTSDLRSNQPEEFTYTTASNKSAGKKRLHSTKPKVKTTTPRKSTRSNTSNSINILDILMKSNRGQKTLKRSMLKQDLHIVLGRLAIPIKIIPDY